MFQPEARNTAFAGGFYLTNGERANVAHFEERKLPGGWSLWADQAVETGIALDESGDFVVIRGEAVDLQHGAADVDGLARELLALLVNSPIEMLERLGLVGGRYVVVFRSKGRLSVCHDALGMRSVYYAAEQSVVASHFNLLLPAFEEPNWLHTKAALTTLDFTPSATIRSLLPNFFLDVGSGRVHRFYPTRPNGYSDEYAESRLDEIAQLCHRYIDVYATSFDGLALSVTGGQDSRLMLALAKAHGANIEGFTYGSPNKDALKREGYWAESMQLDHDVVQTLLPYLQLRRHHFIDITPYNSGALASPLSRAELDLIRSNTWAAHGQYLVGIYRQLFSGGDWAHLRASGVEIGRRARTPQVDTFDALLRKHSSEEAPRADVVDAGKRLRYDTDLHGYSRWDLAYWEIRMGKWHAEMMNEHDAAFSSFVPIGSRRVLDLLLSFTPEQRRGQYAVKELINREAPLLNFFGTNDRRNLYEKIRDETGEAAVEEVAATPRFSSVSVYGPSGTVEHRHAVPAESIYLGSRFFVKGVRVRGAVFRAPASGNLRMVLENVYERAQGVGSFEWRILVDDEVVVHGDGAKGSDPVTVSIIGIRPRQAVSLELVAHKTRPAPSWQAATVTKLREVDFSARAEAVAEGMLVGCDSPFAIVTQPGEPA